MSGHPPLQDLVLSLSCLCLFSPPLLFLFVLDHTKKCSGLHLALQSLLEGLEDCAGNGNSVSCMKVKHSIYCPITRALSLLFGERFPPTFFRATNSFSAAVRLLISSSYL